MARPVFAQELQDPDFAWLLNTLRERRPDLLLLDALGCSVVLLPAHHSPVALPTPESADRQLLPQAVSADVAPFESPRKRS